MQHDKPKDELRRKAEKILRQRGIKDDRLYALDLEQLVEELNIFQIELEHQNHELRHTQEELTISRNLYADLFNNAPTAFLNIDRNYKIINTNKAALSLLNIDRKTLLDTLFYKFIRPEYQDKFLFYLRKIENAGPNCNPVYIEVELNTTENEIRYVKIGGKPCCSDNETDKQFILTLTDLTEERRANQEILIRNTALASAANSIVITDTEGTIEWVNKAFSKLTGYTSDEAVGKNPRDIVKSGIHPTSFFTSLWQTITSGRVWKGKVINKRKDGTLYTEEQTISPVLDERGEIIRYIAVQSDITEKIKLENELVDAKEKAEESNRLKSAFLANISHEIRTPMNGILGFAELLQRPKLDSDKREHYINVISQSGRRMLRILNDLIDISKIEAGEITVSNEFFEIDKLLSELSSFFESEAKSKNIEISFECIGDPKDKIIETDKTKIGQIFSNLISNAVKYTDKGSIHCRCEIINKQLTFTVEDTGIGIPELIKSKIFDRFRRFDEHHIKFREGVGLGLAISKAYADLLNGTLDVESELGRGSKFTFTMPLDNTDINFIPYDKKAKAPKNAFDSQIILVAEDDDDNYLYMQELLSDTNLNLIRAANGKEALKLLEEHPDVKLVLMDVRMPEMDGLEACKRIKKKNLSVPIIIQTAYAFDEDRQKAFEAGCDDFISKPLEQSVLFSKMNALLK